MKQSILITGCSTGIGYAVAHDLHHAGYQVFATCRKQNDVDRLNNLGLNCLLLDVTNTESINSALETILTQTNGKLDILFNNAGFGIPGAVEDLSKKALQQQFNTNVFGLIELTNKVLPIMRQQGSGKIIVNSSVLGFISLRYRGSYVSSKFALEGLFDTLRLELRHSPIHISLIQPGPVTSKFRDNSYQNFLKYIDAENSAHNKQYQAMRKRFLPNDFIPTESFSELDISIIDTPNTPAPFELPASAVTKTILKIINARKPRARYSITFPTYLFRALVRVLPTSLLDRILYKVTKSETE